MQFLYFHRAFGVSLRKMADSNLFALLKWAKAWHEIMDSKWSVGLSCAAMFLIWLLYVATGGGGVSAELVMVFFAVFALSF